MPLSDIPSFCFILAQGTKGMASHSQDINFEPFEDDEARIKRREERRKRKRHDRRERTALDNEGDPELLLKDVKKSKRRNKMKKERPELWVDDRIADEAVTDMEDEWEDLYDDEWDS